MDSDGYYWFDSPTMEYGNEEDDVEEDSESQTESPSLPSLPISLQEQLACPDMSYSQRNQAMSMKEIDAKLNTLRRENFDLKLRLFYEKRNNGSRRTDGDSFITKEFERYEKTLEEYKKSLASKDHQIVVLTNRLEEAERDKEFEIGLLKNERDAFASDLQVATSICKSFMSHLFEVREFWTQHLTEKGIDRNEEFIDSVNNWLNSSEDLLNSASVLITDEFDGNLSRKIGMESLINGNQGNPMNDIDLADNEKREYLKHKNFLYNISSESEDEWSEPDRTVSKSRIGIETLSETHSINQINRAPLKSRSKRLSSSGMSSLGLLSDFSEFIAERQRGIRQKKVITVDNEIQTLLGSDDLEKLITCYQENKKTVNNSQTQTGYDLKASYQTSQSCQTISPLPNVECSVQTEPELGLPKKNDATMQTELLSVSSKANQTETRRQLSEKGVQFVGLKEKTKSTDSLASVTKSAISSGIKGHSQKNNLTKDFNKKHELNRLTTITTTPTSTKSTSANQKSLYSYKSVLSPMTRSSSFCKSIDYSETLKEMRPQMLYTFSHRETRKSVPNELSRSLKSQFSSCDHIDLDKKVGKHEDDAFTNERRTPSKHFTMSSSYSTSKIYDIINNQLKGFKEKDSHWFEKKTINNHQLDLKSAKGFATSEDTDKCHLSSPDLGIGDSDQDVNSTLRSYISLGYYQLLRGNLNQISSYLDCLDNLYRDCFILQSINLQEYSTGVKPNLSNLHQIVNSSRSICKNFTIEDENSISVQLEKIKAKKENMEKAITRQLRKTDKLLRKAKLNLKES